MKCHVCGATMHEVITDLPFKVSESAIVILKELPVLQCENCTQFLIEDSVMARVEALLENADTAAELEIIKYAA